jgi:hypothetical protein
MRVRNSDALDLDAAQDPACGKRANGEHQEIVEQAEMRIIGNEVPWENDVKTSDYEQTQRDKLFARAAEQL